jgi:hypothetical protein
MSSQAETPIRILRPVATPRLAPTRFAAARKAPLGVASEARPSRSRTPIELTVEVLRGPFRPLIVWGLFWGPRPFSELMRHVPDVTKRALRRELVEMERIGLVVRDVRLTRTPRLLFAERVRRDAAACGRSHVRVGLLCAQPRRSREESLRGARSAPSVARRSRGTPRRRQPAALPRLR